MNIWSWKLITKECFHFKFMAIHINEVPFCLKSTRYSLSLWYGRCVLLKSAFILALLKSLYKMTVALSHSIAELGAADFSLGRRSEKIKMITNGWSFGTWRTEDWFDLFWSLLFLFFYILKVVQYLICRWNKI